MQAVRVGSVQSVSWMALVVVVVVLVYLPCQSTGYSVSKSEGGTELMYLKYLLGKDDFKNNYEEHHENDYEEDDISADDLITDDLTTDDLITDDLTTDDLITDDLTTDDVTTSTVEVTTSTDDLISSTGNSISTDITSSTDDTTTEKSTTTVLPTLSEQQVYEYTRDELSETENILDLFLSLVSENLTPGPHDHPGVWWKFRMDQTQDEICIDSEYKLCLELLKCLNETEILVSKLGNDVDSWRQEDLQELIEDNVALTKLHTKAEDDENFIPSINKNNFKALIEDFNKEVKISLDGVKQKIVKIEQAKTDSVVLVAVIGTLGGLMVVGLVGVMIYGGVKRKGSKTPTSKPYNKLQGEHIPIDGFLSDGPEHRQPPRMDPYAPRMPPPSSSGDRYAAPSGVRSESDYSREPVVTRVGQKLPRTYF